MADSYLFDEFAAAGIASLRPIGASIGDSIATADYNGSDRVSLPATPTTVLKSAKGIVSWALVLCHQRVEIPTQQNIWGFPSQDTDVILANLPAFWSSMARKPCFMYVHCGTNDVLHGIPYATTVANLEAIAVYNAQRGCRTIFGPILPRSASYTAAQFEKAGRINRWLTKLAARAQGVVAVISSALVDVTDPASNGTPKTDVTYDGTHPAILGGYYYGKALASVLRNWFPPVDLLPNNNHVWAAGLTNVNYVANAMMEGAGGTVTSPRTAVTGTSTSGSPNLTGLSGTVYAGDFVTGAGIPAGTTILTGGSSTAVMSANATANGTPSISAIGGTAPTSWTATMSNTLGLNVAHSQVISPVSNRRMHQMVFSGSYTASGVSAATWGPFGRLQQNVATTALASIAAGDTVESFVEFEIDAGNNVIAFPRLEMRWKGNTNYNSDMQIPDLVGGLPSEAISGVLRTPPHTYVSGELPLAAGEIVHNFYAMLRANDGTYSPAATIRFGRASLQKVD